MHTAIRMDASAVRDASWVRTHEWRLIVGGVRSEAASGRTFENWSPVTEDVVCELPDATAGTWRWARARSNSWPTRRAAPTVESGK
jgi:hypothetical protein